MDRTNKEYGKDYEALEKRASDDPNALVIGLKEPKPKNLKTVSIDNVSILDQWQIPNYPLRMPVTVFFKKTAPGPELYLKRLKLMGDHNKLEQYFQNQIKAERSFSKLKR